MRGIQTIRTFSFCSMKSRKLCPNPHVNERRWFASLGWCIHGRNPHFSPNALVGPRLPCAYIYTQLSNTKFSKILSALIHFGGTYMCHNIWVEVTEQSEEACSFYHVDSGNWTRVIRPGSKRHFIVYVYFAWVYACTQHVYRTLGTRKKAADSP